MQIYRRQIALQVQHQLDVAPNIADQARASPALVNVQIEQQESGENVEIGEPNIPNNDPAIPRDEPADPLQRHKKWKIIITIQLDWNVP